jgi:hypothetical protein
MVSMKRDPGSLSWLMGKRLENRTKTGHRRIGGDRREKWRPNGPAHQMKG